MKIILVPTVLFFLSLSISPFYAFSQEENATAAIGGTRYIDLKIKKLDKYNSRIKKQQDRMLKKLKNKENHLERKLQRTDSLAYAKFKKQTLSYDSISKVSKSDTGSKADSFAKKKNPTIDSLRGVESFVQCKSGQVPSSPEVQEKNAELSSVQGKLNFRNYITQLITQRTNNLSNLQGDEGKAPGLIGIQKQVYYGKAKMKAYKDMYDDPTKAEDKTLEYLDGTNGFEKSFNNSSQGGTSIQTLGASGADANKLEKMGYQTQHQFQSNLLQKFGNNLGGLSQKISGELTQFQNKQNDLSTIKETKQSLFQLKHTAKPAFQVNPMRGLPFWKRIQKQYSWQTTRANSDGTQPSTIQPSIMVGFKQTPKITYGLGCAISIGLGQSWQNVYFSYQGTGLRSFITWQWQYGIGIYAGYERLYKNFVFTSREQQPNSDIITSPHNNSEFSESVLIGLTKSYHLNKNYNGSIQVLYDIWWAQKGLSGPIVLRFATIKK